MSKKKAIRHGIFLECQICKVNGNPIFRYRTEKNKKNSPIKLELNKYCKVCFKHTTHKETK